MTGISRNTAFCFINNKRKIESFWQSKGVLSTGLQNKSGWHLLQGQICARGCRPGVAWARSHGSQLPFPVLSARSRDIKRQVQRTVGIHNARWMPIAIGFLSDLPSGLVTFHKFAGTFTWSPAKRCQARDPISSLARDLRIRYIFF